MLMADGEAGAECYSIASSVKQGKIIYNEAKTMVEQSPDLKPITERIPSTSRIAFPRTRSWYEVLSTRVDSAEGWNAHFFCVDELHRMKDSDLFDAIRYSTDSRTQGMFFTISTAGAYDPESVAWRQWQYARDVESGIITDTSFFPLIFCADPEDDWTKEETWFKANPSLGFTLQLDEFRREFEEAVNSPTAQPGFLRRKLNRWTQASSVWIPDDRWMKCDGSIEVPDDQKNEVQWVGGLDLASSIDISAFVLLGKHDDHFIIKPYFWINAEQASLRQKRDGVTYDTWCREKWITQTPGSYVDQERIRQDVLKICEEHKCRRVGVDMWQAAKIVTELQGDGLDIGFVGQGYKSMSAPTKEIERLVYGEFLRHGGNPVLRWMLSNVEIETDAAGNVKPSKKRSREKIDGIVALCMAVFLMLGDKGPSVYESHGIEVF